MFPHPFCYSMVVDGHPIHPYQAETLLFTLEKYTDAPRDQIFVQCTERVSEEVRSAFAESRYRVASFSPYLDGKYCNKIAQLDRIVENALPDAQGVFLLDLDFVVLAPLEVKERNCVWGKIVDGPNPPLPVLKRIFCEGGVEIPGVVSSDWGAGDTVSTNFNGGFLYIPLPQVSRVRSAWRKWAEFLYARPDLFEHPSQRMHTDQIAFAMGLASACIPYRHLSANWNFPLHRPDLPQSFRPEMPVHGLHYHRCLDTFGLIDPVFGGSRVIGKAVARVNAAIGTQGPSLFFKSFKRHRAQEAMRRVPDAGRLAFSDDFLVRTRRGDRRRRLILHAGTPKTGTTALQWHLASNADELASRGFWYPAPSKHTHEPKHQQLVGLLRKGEDDGFRRYIEDALRDMPDDAHSIIFTTEGIFNHWWDFPPRAKGWLRQLAALFDFELCVWFREPESFTASLYVQYLKNGPVDDVMRNVYGRDVSFTDALGDEWFRRHLDYLGFYYEARILFGAGSVKAFLSTRDTIQTFAAHCGIESLPNPDPKRQNATPGAVAVRMLRATNRAALKRPKRLRRIAFIEKLDQTVGGWTGRFGLNERERRLVGQFARRGWSMMRREAG